MKKFLISLICVFSLITMPVKAEEIELPEVTDHEKVTIYIFRGKGCGFCYNSLVYFNEIAKDYADYFEVKTYEVWNSQENSELLAAVASANEDELGGVPYIVIGDSYSTVGFLKEWGEEIIETALKEYQNKDYVDLVAEIAKEHPDAEETTLKEACIEEGIITQGGEKAAANDTVIILSIFAVVIVGVTALVLFSRKK